MWGNQALRLSSTNWPNTEGQDVRTLVSTIWVISGLIIHNTPWSFALLPAEGKTRRECFPHLRAQLAGLHFGLLLESVVGIVVSEGILDEGREHKHVANPEVNIQGLDGWCSRQGGAGAHHQRGHGEDSCDTWRKGGFTLNRLEAPLRV